MCVRRIFAASRTALASCNISFFSHFAVPPPPHNVHVRYTFKRLQFTFSCKGSMTCRFAYIRENGRAVSLFDPALWRLCGLSVRSLLCLLSVTHIGNGSQFIYCLHVSKFYRFSVCYDITGISIAIDFLILNRVAQITICWIKEKMVKFTISCLVNIVAELLCIASTFFAEAWAKQWCIYF